MAPPQMQPQGPSSAVLAGRIQGFGNVNPPPVPEEDAKSVAKRAAKNLGSIVGEELVLTVQDFREKGAVVAVKDAVFDAGDILVDGVAGVFGWLRGDPPPEEEADEEKSQAAQDVLTHAPAGAAYGVSQASPTGGINAVWVMPEEADPAMLAELAQQQAPPGIQPYQAPGSSRAPAPYMPGPGGAGGFPMQLPGGPTIAPYEPAPKFGGFVPGGQGRAPGFPQPFVPGAQPGFPGAPGGFPGAHPGYGQAPGAGGAGGVGGLGRVKSLVEQVASGATLAGPEVAKRVVSTCSSTQVSTEQLAEAIAERTRRIYLGLDASSAADSDGALARLLGLTGCLAQQEGSRFAQDAAKAVAKKVPEELQSLSSSAKHRTAAEPLLRALGLGAPAAETVDLLGEASSSSSAARPQEIDLLGVGQPASSSSGDLLGF